MSLSQNSQAQSVSLAEKARPGRYLYCVADAGERVSLGPIGIEGNEVYTIPYRDVSVIAHSCVAHPYQSHQKAAVEGWVMAHHHVVETAWHRWGTVIPINFDTIISDEASGDAEQDVLTWLQGEYGRLQNQIERLRGKAEYGVQVFWDPDFFSRKLSRANQEIHQLIEDIKAQPPGLAYMRRQKLEALLKGEMETQLDQLFKELYRRFKGCVVDIRIERAKRTGQGLPLFMNLCCLVENDSYPALGTELNRVNRRAGLSVRLTGPWPPYSFTTLAE